MSRFIHKITKSMYFIYGNDVALGSFVDIIDERFENECPSGRGIYC